jgi:hypothetical protein
MRYFYRILFVLLLSATVMPGFSQEDQFRKDRKRVWKKWRSNKQSYNPYLDRKKKNKPSAVMARENKRELKHQKRVAKRQMRRSKRRVGRK